MAPRLTLVEIHERLLAQLREDFDTPGLAYAKPPEFLKYVQSAICAFELEAPPPELSGPLIVRIRRRPRHARFARLEFALHNALSGAGISVPRAVLVSAGDGLVGLPFVVTQRVQGEPALRRFSGPLAFARLPLIMARVQRRLHALDVDAFLRDVQSHGIREADLPIERGTENIERRAQRQGLVWLKPCFARLREMRPAGGVRVVCHGDLGGGNVMLHRGEVAGVIDWDAAVIAEPAFDIAATLAAIERCSDLAHPLRPIFSPMVPWLRERYLRAYDADPPIDMEAVRYYQAVRIVQRIVRRPEKAHRHVTSLRRLTGVTMRPPPAP